MDHHGEHSYAPAPRQFVRCGIEVRIQIYATSGTPVMVSIPTVGLKGPADRRCDCLHP